MQEGRTTVNDGEAHAAAAAAAAASMCLVPAAANLTIELKTHI
jgi:hypothetical protein